MSSQPRRARSKLVTRVEAVRSVRTAQRRGERVVFTNGCFDLLHVGHVRSLEQAKRHGDRLIVAVNSDKSVHRLKGPGRPLMPARQRAEILAGLECVDWVTVFRDPTPLSVILALRPNVLAKGGDWRLDQIIGRDQVEGWGGRVVRLTQVRGVRSSVLIEKLR